MTDETTNEPARILAAIDDWRREDEAANEAGEGMTDTDPLAAAYALASDVCAAAERWIRAGRDEEIARLRAQVDELQARGSALEDERRMWKSRAQTSRTMIDALVALILSWYGDAEAMRESAKQVARVASRNELLERDAWTMTTQAAREFVEACATPMGDYAPLVVHAVDDGCTLAPAFVREWRDRFKAILGDG